MWQAQLSREPASHAAHQHQPAQATPAQPAQPHLVFAEMFAGERAISKGMLAFGYAGRSYDLRLSSLHNFLNPVGFLSLLATIMGMCQGGVLWLAPPCSTWVWMSRSSTGRHIDILGFQEESHYVKSQNMLVDRMVYLLILCIKRGVHFIVEQPASSIMWQYPRMSKFLKRFEGRIKTIKMQMGCYSLQSPKDTTLVGTPPYMTRLARTMTPTEKEAMRPHQLQTATVSYTAQGKRQCTGTKDLKSTQTYPLGFGAAHANAFHDALHDTVAQRKPGLSLDPEDTEGSEIGDKDDECLQDVLTSNTTYWDSNVKNENKLPLVNQ